MLSACNNRQVVISRATHLAKGLAAASIATFVALFGHVLGGGGVPSGVGIVASLVLSSAVCVVIAGRRLSIMRLTLSVAISQVLFHFLFVLGSTSHHVVATHEGHHGATALATTATHAAASMGAGHVVAAVVTIAVLYFGERVARGLAELALLVASRLLRTFRIPVAPSAAPGGPLASAWRVFVPRALDDAASLATRRGPPALTA